ncbi:acyltransferase [Phascolarctobacterium sp. Marseille-Q4147]|uniref:acyltransferase n=1 Tax=Phascolarctobacterium sp. Marseille-Q4147 TaxID=2823317 RepID=UPI001B334F53|nr:acyltransferase [Phascolarctobacterium sp. Marseille-Q4147]QTV77358.1 acyltransferase [Phascolarctobacterium sp. Marseille-Q4147]
MRNTIIDNLRGICMLGVIGIHIGSLALAPNNFTLYLLLEILSRYSVPSFFFISGYGLTCTDKGLLSGSRLNYIDFIKKRLRGAGLPYLSWSLFYMLYFWLILPPGFVSWNPLHVAYVLFFGLGCYHLYFMVILLWFYASYPLWRQLLRIIIHQSIPFMLVLLFIFQLAFNWWTTHPGLNTAGWSVIAKNFFDYRLNYLPLHYLLIFMSGGLAACYWEKFIALLRRYSAIVCMIFAASVAWDVQSCYEAVTVKGYTLIDLANTYHQLSPQGLCYTVGSLLFFCLALDWLERRAQAKAHTEAPNALQSIPQATSHTEAPLGGSCHRKVTERGSLTNLLYKAISILSAYSMLIYFVHPLLLDWLSSAYNHFGIIMTVKKVALSYVLLVLGSLAFSILLTKAFEKCSTAKLLFTGKR